MERSERVAVVTGGSGGIGGAICTRLAMHGHAVVINFKTNRTAAEDTVRRITRAGGQANAICADVSKKDGIEYLFKETERLVGNPTILVNNAAVRHDSLAATMTDPAWDEVIKTNLYAPFACARRALRGMLRARWGRIVNLGSAVAFRGCPGQVNYAAAKAGLIGVTKSLARELATRGITVNLIAPGLVETAMTADVIERDSERLLAQVPMGRLGEAEEVAALAAFLCSEEARFVTGSVIVADGGVSA